MGIGVELLDAVTRELMMFAGVGFLLGGVDDLLVDLLWLASRTRARFAPDPRITDLPPAPRLRFAIFVAAWREAGVVGPMLREALRAIDHPDYRLYVGTYPNDAATIAEVHAVAALDARVRLVIGAVPGPTTKGANLNVLWRALLEDEMVSGRSTNAVVIHDAEDVIHPDELTVHQAALADADVSQLPVVPLIDDSTLHAQLVSGVYADEFAASHRVTLPVRVAIGAGLPLAGVGCAIRTEALRRAGDGEPFEAISLTEDYEQGLLLSASGCRARFMRVRAADGVLIATRAYFPASFAASTSQKARWMTGIALAGWDRVGWGRPLAFAEHWMRARDRRAPLATLVTAAGYLAFVLASLSLLLHALLGSRAPSVGSLTGWLLLVDGALLAWRVVARIVHTRAVYGIEEAVWSVPRMLVGNAVSAVAICRALARYVRVLRGGAQRWEKTEHVFPDLSEPDLAR